MSINTVATVKTGYILEYQTVNDLLPALEENNTGNILFSAKTKWIFPFKKTKIQLNIKNLLLPNNTKGLISTYCKSNKIHVFLDIVTDNEDVLILSVMNTGILPIKIKAGDELAMLNIIPIVSSKAIKD